MKDLNPRIRDERDFVDTRVELDVVERLTSVQTMSAGYLVAVLSGQARGVGLAGANVSSFMPAIGVLAANVLSGDPVAVITLGEVSSPLYNFSGAIGRAIYVSTSTSGIPRISGGFLSGEVQQMIGRATNASTLNIEVGTAVQQGEARF